MDLSHLHTHFSGAMVVILGRLEACDMWERSGEHGDARSVQDHSPPYLLPTRLRVPGQGPGGLLSDPGAPLCARKRSPELAMWGHGGR